VAPPAARRQTVAEAQCDLREAVAVEQLGDARAQVIHLHRLIEVRRLQACGGRREQGSL